MNRLPPQKPKTDPLGWIRAFLFPKKGAPLPAQSPAPQRNQFGSNAPAPAPAKDASSKRENLLRRVWTFGSILSIVVNVVLLVVVLVLGNQLFILKQMVGDQLLGGLYLNFVKMDQANITSNIVVDDTIPIDFDLTISQDTVVTLTQDTFINDATIVSLNTGGLAIRNAPADITLPAGLELPVHLELTVPVQKTIPVHLNVAVDIPLDKTELHEPFVGLQEVVSPYYWMLQPEWKTCADVPVINWLGSICNLFFANTK